MPFNIDAAVSRLDEIAKKGPTGHCAKHVRMALEAGGVTVTLHPVRAKDYGPYLELTGFRAVAVVGYVPRRGDIVVIQPCPNGDQSGHIAMYDGSEWVSDFVQKDVWGGPGYRASKPPHTFYRS